MKIGIFFATREGQTQRIADHLAATLAERNIAVDVKNVAELGATPKLDGYAALILAASVHLAQHEREMVAFVKKNHDALDRVPCAFVSVSLSEAGAEDQNRSPERRARAANDVQGVLDQFFKTTQWWPGLVLPVAGALKYTKYNALVRWVIKLIAKSNGASTDTSRDHELTDWSKVDRFASDFVAQLPKR